MGRQGSEEITVHDMAKLKNSVSYEVLTNWRLRLRRKSVNAKAAPPKIEAEPAAAK
jgi:alanine racemase